MTETEGLWPLCETCGAVPTSHKDYRDCEAHMQVVAQAYDAGRENGGRQERAAVVAWLREEANAPHPIEAGERALSPSGRGLLMLNASRIERGDHRREGDE